MQCVCVFIVCCLFVVVSVVVCVDFLIIIIILSRQINVISNQPDLGLSNQKKKGTYEIPIDSTLFFSTDKCSSNINSSQIIQIEFSPLINNQR